jgi:hypothetical protein
MEWIFWIPLRVKLHHKLIACHNETFVFKAYIINPCSGLRHHKISAGLLCSTL